MNIGIINPELIHPRGAEKQACKLCYFLNKMGHEVTFYTIKKTENYVFDPLLSNIEVISLNTRWILNMPWMVNDLRWIYLLRKLSQRIGKHDIINANNHPAQWISKFTDIPVVWMCNEPYMYNTDIIKNRFNSPHYMTDRYMSSNVKLILSLDYKMEEIIRNMYPDKPVSTITSGVDLERDVEHVKDDYFDSIFVGPIHPQKRPLDIVRAFSVLKDKIKNIKLHFVGEVISFDIKKEMEKISVNSNLGINFYGPVSDEKLYELYDIADIAIFVPESEPWGIFPLETILGGIPTIISDQCGASRIIDNNFVVRTGDINHLAKKILEVYNENDKYLKKTYDMRKNISKNYSWFNYSNKIEKIFDKLV